MPSVLWEPNSEWLRWQHTESVVSSHRQGKLLILLNSLGNELQVGHWYGKNTALQPDHTVFGAVWCKNWKKCWQTSGSSFPTQKTSLVTKSHLDAKLQCCSCYLWHVSLFSWWFSILVESFVTRILKKFGQISYFISLKASFSLILPFWISLSPLSSSIIYVVFKLLKWSVNFTDSNFK